MSDVVEALRGATAAEEVFRLLGVPFDPRVVHVARLHNLRRLHEAMSATPTESALRAALAAAHAEFAAHAPVERRLFKVHRDAVRPQGRPAKRRGFVPLSAVTREA